MENDIDFNRAIVDLVLEAKEKSLKKITFYKVVEDIDDYPKYPEISLPVELFDLTHLEELNLNPFRLKEVPKEFSNLKNLKTLFLNLNTLEFPTHLMDLKKLSDLSVWGSFQELPKVLDNWEALRYLYIENKNLSLVSGIPRKLTYLYLKGNGFKSFPRKILDAHCYPCCGNCLHTRCR